MALVCLSAARMVLSLLLYFALAANAAAELDISPPAFLAGVTQSVQLTCRPPQIADIARVLTLQLHRRQEGGAQSEPVASYIVTDLPVVESAGASMSAVVSGSYDPAHPSTALLSVNLPQPTDEVEGSYVCSVETLDSHGLLHHYQTQGSLVSLALNGSTPVFYHNLLRELRTDLDTLTSDLSTVRTSQADVVSKDSTAQMQLAVIERDVTKINGILNDVNTTLSDVNYRTDRLQSQLLRLRDVTPENPVNFYAYISSSYITPAVDANIVFNVVEQHTDDNAYSTSTGVFTTPVNGTYFFRTGLTYDGTSGTASIVANNQTVASAVCNDDYNLQQATAVVVLKLSAGEEVRVVKRKGSNVYGYSPNSSTTHHSYFMGTLLW